MVAFSDTQEQYLLIINVAEHIYDVKNAWWGVKIFKGVTEDTLKMCS